MAEHPILTKYDGPARSTGSSIELSNSTITWANLTGKGFSAGDVVVIYYRQWLSNNNITHRATSELLSGASFGAATKIHTDSFNVVQGASTTPAQGGREVGFLVQHTLVANDNIYWNLIASGGSAFSAELSAWVFSLEDLTVDVDYYLEITDTYSGDAPATVTTAETITLPTTSGGKYGFLGCLNWNVDGNSQLSNGRLTHNASGHIVNKFIGRGTTEVITMLFTGYVDSAVTDEVALLEYWDAGENDLNYSAFFAIDLSLFELADGNVDLTSVAVDATLDTPKETNSITLSPAAGRDICFFAQTIADITAAAMVPYTSVELDSAEILTNLGRQGYRSKGSNEEIPLTVHGLAAAVESGPQDLKVYGYEDIDNDPSYNFDRHTLFFFTTELAGGAWDQDQFRFGADDNNEATHGWLAAQNANITEPASTQALLRIQATSSGDQPAVQMKLQAKLSTDADTEYKDVPIA